jgi:hypothetical protein
MDWVKIGEVVVRFIESGTMKRGGFIQAQKNMQWIRARL